MLYIKNQHEQGMVANPEFKASLGYIGNAVSKRNSNNIAVYSYISLSWYFGNNEAYAIA